MKTNRELREALSKARKNVSEGLWGLYGTWHGKHPPVPTQGPFEAAPGLSIGSTSTDTPLARLSGHGHNVIANANYMTLAVNYLQDLIDDINELEEENEILVDKITRMLSGEKAS